MGKRPIIPTNDLQHFVTPPTRRTIRKRKVSNGNIGAAVGGVGRPAKTLRLNSDADDDEDSSSNDTHLLNCSTKHANNSSILLNSSIKLEQSSPATNDSPRPVYTLRPSIVNGTILYDLTEKPWRLGNPIGKGNFGEIFLASDNITIPVTNENAKFVVKIEPHSNGPLFVEIHCLINTAKNEEDSDEKEVTVEEKIKQGHRKPIAETIKPSPPMGIPDYIASGSHFFGDARYRFLVLQRFDQDLHSLIKNSCVAQKSALTLAIQIVNVLEHLHDKGYCHNDVKSQNLMISKCKYYKNQNSTLTKSTAQATAKTTKTLKKASKYLDNYEEKQPTTDSGNSSEQEANDYEDEGDEDFVVKRKSNRKFVEETSEDDDEDFDDGTTTSNSNSLDVYKTPVLKGRNNRRRLANNRTAVQYSGSNPVRSCRRGQRPNSIYEEMVNSHYLRPSNKRISYTEFFDEDGNSIKGDSGPIAQNNVDESRDTHFNSTEDDDSNNTFLPISMRRRFEQTKTASASSKQKSSRNARTSKASNSNKTKNSPPKRLTRRQEKLLNEQQKLPQSNFEPIIAQQQQQQQQTVLEEAEHIFLIDFGLASKYIDRGVHRPFIMDQRRAHDGTLEFTSRDAHMGAHSRRSDLECLGYNLLYWTQGFLPWKDAAAQQQQEKVHRAKEYLMTDVREMLKLIYGKDVPKYLGEFLHLVGQLAYHERPQYARYRRLFENEYRQLGYSLSNMCLDSQEIAQTCIRIRKDHGASKHDFFDQNNKLSNSHILSIMKSGGNTPFQDHRGSLGDRVSPKNLRSKSDKKATRKKKFCWAEVLSQDPDQIARERAEKEFDRELNDEEERPVRRYEGNPTYAILNILMKNEDKFEPVEDEDDDGEDDEQIEEDGQEDVGDDEEENEASEASEMEVEASDDNYEIENDSDQSMQETNGSDNEDDKESTENELSDEESDDIDEDDEIDDSDENDVESDVSEASSNSEQYGTRGRNKQRINTAFQKATKGKPTKPTRRAVSAANSRSSKSTTGSSKASRVGRSRGLTKPVTTRSNGSVRVTKMTTQQQKLKRTEGEKTKRKTGGAFAASAAGEIEQQALKQFLFDHQDELQQQETQLNGKISSRQRGQRKQGRQKKTESHGTLMNGVSGGGVRVSGNHRGGIGMYGVEDDSNSNFMMLNVWNVSNENIYARNAAAAAKSITAGGGSSGMVTRHYRK